MIRIIKIHRVLQRLYRALTKRKKNMKQTKMYENSEQSSKVITITICKLSSLPLKRLALIQVGAIPNVNVYSYVKSTCNVIIFTHNIN